MANHLADQAEIDRLAALAERIPAEVRRSLEAQVPLSEECRFNRGVLAGLEFALQAVRAGNGQGEPPGEYLAQAAAVTASHIARRDEEEFRAAYARLKEEWSKPEVIEADNELLRRMESGEEPTYPFEQMLQELEEEFGPDFTGGPGEQP